MPSEEQVKEWSEELSSKLGVKVPEFIDGGDVIAATNGKQIMLGEAFFAMQEAQARCVLAHELAHVSRRGLVDLVGSASISVVVLSMIVTAFTSSAPVLWTLAYTTIVGAVLSFLGLISFMWFLRQDECVCDSIAASLTNKDDYLHLSRVLEISERGLQRPPKLFCTHPTWKKRIEGLT